MSYNQGYGDSRSQGGNLVSNNPYGGGGGGGNSMSQQRAAQGYQEGQQNVRGYQDGYEAYQDGYQRAYQRQQQSMSAGNNNYEPPPGPPPRRTDTFQEERFVPASERGEQREAMEDYEMRRSKPQSQDERNVAQLQDEFPSVDGSLVAAIYGDTQSLGPAREMLQELNSQNQSVNQRR